jgi:hypothetical protein
MVKKNIVEKTTMLTVDDEIDSLGVIDRSLEVQIPRTILFQIHL